MWAEPVVGSVYNCYEYDAEKRAALELWADALDSIISGTRTEIDSYAVRLARLKGAVFSEALAASGASAYIFPGGQHSPILAEPVVPDH